jgi:outer membrane lipoprotein-sorting protein
MSGPRSRGRAAIGAALLLIGCHRLPPRAAPAPTSAAALTEAQALELVARREAETRTLTATFKMTVRRPNRGEETNQGALVVARPDRLRMQIFSFGVMTAYDFTVNGDRYRIRRPLEGVDERGRFSELAPDDPTAAALDLRPLFLGAPAVASARVRDRGDAYLVAAGEGRGRHEIQVSKQGGRIEAETVYDDDQPRILVAFRDHRLVDGAAIPFAIHVEYPDSGATLDIEVVRYTRNQPVDSHLFEF